MIRRQLTVALGLAVGTAAAPAYAFWAATGASAGPAAAKATTVNVGSTPTTSVSGSNVTVSWPASTLANGQAVSGYQVTRYDASTGVAQTVGAGCSGTLTGTACIDTALAEGRYRYTVVPLVGDSWRGAEGPRSASTTVDVTPPTTSIALTSSTGGGSVKSGSTVYFRGSVAGSFKLANTVADSLSGPASSTTAALVGTTTGWTHTPSTVSTPSGGPYVSATFSWTAAATASAPTETVTGSDASGNTTPTTLSFTNDSTAPATGTVGYSTGYLTTRSVTVSFTAGVDAGSGLASTKLQRATAPLAGGACGAFGAFTDLGAANPTSPYVDTALANSTCYQYRLAATDAVGNTGFTTGGVARLDYSNTVQNTAGLVSYWRLGESRTPVTLTADSFTGPAGSTLDLHTGETGATWTKMATLSDSDVVLLGNGQVHKGNSSTGTATRSALYYSSGVPPSPNYSVSSDITLLSTVTNDGAGVLGRINTTTFNLYAAAWDSSNNRWALYALINGSPLSLATSTSQPLTAAGTARLTLDMDGPTIRVLVNGVQVISVQDSQVTAAGRPGIFVGGNPNGALTTLSDTTGLQLANAGFRAGASGSVDAKGANSGVYNATAFAAAGALGADSNGASTFDGTQGYMQVAAPSKLPTGAAARSVELWFKTTSTSRQVLFDYGSQAAPGQELGLWLDAGGATLTAWGYGSSFDKSFTPAGPLTNGAWHHVVETYDGSSLTLYVDGVGLPSQPVLLATALDGYGFTVGAVLNQNDPNAAGGFFNGTIDDVSLYDVALPPATVTQHYLLGTAR